MTMMTTCLGWPRLMTVTMKMVMEDKDKEEWEESAEEELSEL